MLLIGSFLVFIGIILLSWNTFIALRDEVYSDLKIEIVTDDEETITSVPVANNVESENEQTTTTEVSEASNYEAPIDYDKYLGVLEIPRISLKRGFYGVDNKYNDIQYNVTLVRGSMLPDVPKGNLILMAHSGDAYISYFAYLYRLEVGDSAFVTYNGIKYEYRIVDIYEVLKNGIVSIRRNREATTLTMITCTKGSDTLQTIYIAELVY